MAQYIVNKNSQPNGDHEVHIISPLNACNYLPDPVNMVKLGDHNSCHSAVQTAKNLGYKTADGCAYCCTACHSS